MTNVSYVVTGGSQGVGRAIVERLRHDGHVVVLDLAAELSWTADGVELVSGDARSANMPDARPTGLRPPTPWSAG